MMSHLIVVSIENKFRSQKRFVHVVYMNISTKDYGHGVVIKFVSDLWQVGGFLRILRFTSTNKTDCHELAEIVLKVALNTMTIILS
jgi:hypothetical protein